MKVVILASGSKGNSIYIETPKTKILIDSGISLLQTKMRLLNQGIELNQLNSIFITHEHIDHIKCLKNIAKATNATIYLNKKTYNEIVRKKIYDIEMFPVYFINPDTKIFGRSVYLCYNKMCIEGALKKNKIQKC